MTQHPICLTVLRRGNWSGSADICQLDYEQRFLRRKVIEAVSGKQFVVNLSQTTSVDDGDAFELEGGGLVAIKAAPEPLLRVTGMNMARLAWHIGNRHTPCQIEGTYLLIQRDPVIAHMLDHLGADVEEIVAPFTPEGGAYGHGRTHSHDHGATAHAH